MFYDFAWKQKTILEGDPVSVNLKWWTHGQKSTAGAVFSDRFMYRASVLESTGQLSQCPKCFKSHCLFVRGTLPCCMEMDGTGTGERAEHISCIPRSVACSVFPLPLGERQRWGCFTISMFSRSLPPTSDSLSLPFLFLSERRDSQKSALAYSNSPTYHHFIDVFALDLDFFFQWLDFSDVDFPAWMIQRRRNIKKNGRKLCLLQIFFPQIGD